MIYNHLHHNTLDDEETLRYSETERQAASYKLAYSTASYTVQHVKRVDAYTVDSATRYQKYTIH